MKKIGLVTGYTYNLGGTERTICNLLLNSKDDITFDFITDVSTKTLANSTYIESKGCSTIKIKLKKRGRLFSYLKEIKKFFKDNAYKYSSLMVNFGDISDSLFLYYAKKYGIKSRISYAHMGKYETKSFLDKILSIIFKNFIHRYSTVLFASSKKAAEATFFKKDACKTKLYTCINVDKYKFNYNQRITNRNKYNFDNNTFVIGSVSSINDNKNQLYLLEVYEELLKKIKPSSVGLVIVGNSTDDNYFKKISDKISDINSKHNTNIVLLQNTEGSGPIYSMFDLYVQFSKYESFGQALIESSINGLKSIVFKGSYPEYVTDFCNSILIDRGDVNVCVQEIINCYNLKPLRKDKTNNLEQFVTDNLINYL